MKILNRAVKRERSMPVGSDPIFWFNCFFLFILGPVNVFSVAFTSFTFVATLAFIFSNASSFLTFIAFTSSFLVLLSFSKFCDLCWQ